MFFAIKLFVFLLPIILLVAIAVLLDPFRVFGNYDDYLKNQFTGYNRGVVCLKLYERNSKKTDYDSFIFGSSRSQAFKVKNWQLLLPPESKGFHFDGWSDGIYGVYNKIRYIDETGGRLKNALIVVDQDVLVRTTNQSSFDAILPPKLSKESPVAFYLEFVKPLLNLRFVIGYIDYSVFKTYRNYMSNFVSIAKYDNVSDNITGDLYYGYDRMISEDKGKYYNDLINKGVFYERPKQLKKNVPVTSEEKKLLIKIKKILDKHHTDYRIVISPCYDQIPLANDHYQLLKDIFDAGTVYNYSGINKFTDSIYNYYDDSHFRPQVADEIMKDIYLNSGLN
jgi:hypothetical protein